MDPLPNRCGSFLTASVPPPLGRSIAVDPAVVVGMVRAAQGRCAARRRSAGRELEH